MTAAAQVEASFHVKNPIEGTIMQARMTNITTLVPEALQALLALSKAGSKGNVPLKTLNLIRLRASQINGCSVCVNMHAHDARKSGETDQRLFALAAWRETTYFTDAERAALALTEAATRISDRDDAVSDAVWDEAARHYDEKSLASVIIEIALINAWNRLNVTTRQVAGSH